MISNESAQRPAEIGLGWSRNQKPHLTSHGYVGEYQDLFESDKHQVNMKNLGQGIVTG